MARSRLVVATSLVLAAVVGLLAVIGWFGFARLRHSAGTVEAASNRLVLFEDVQRALGTGAVADATYRRSPTPEARARLVTAVTQLATAISAVPEGERSTDQAVLAQLRADSTSYEQELAQDLGATQPAAVDHDSAAVLDSMQRLLVSATHRYQGELQTATTRERVLIGRMSWRAPLTLVLAFTVVGLCWWLLVGYGRHAAVRAELSEQLALRDPLTGVGNRRAFERQFGALIEEPDADTAVLLCDLDGFKQINDTWGHDVGDEVLRTVADRLRATVRGGDLVARLGGDEFVVLVSPARLAPLVSQRLEEAVGRPLQLPDVLVSPRISVGWASLAGDHTRDQVLRAADRRLYDRKRERKQAAVRLTEPRSAAGQ